MKRRDSPGAMEPTIYRIVVRGELSRRYGPAFEGMTLSPDAGQTAITGPVVDQAQLHGLLDRVGDLGLELVSVNAIPEPALPGAVGQTGRAVSGPARAPHIIGQRPEAASAPRLGGSPPP